LLDIDGSCAWVGSDTEIYCIDLDKFMQRFSIELTGVFFLFYKYESCNCLLVVHELGALCVDINGSVVWSVDTDVVEDATYTGDSLKLKTMGDPSELVIDVVSGLVRT